MKVILLEEVHGKGGEGDVVEVSRGFANNYLLKNKLAVKATEGNLKQLEQRRKNIAKREEGRISAAETRKGQLEAVTIKIGMKVGEEGQLFGSVTNAMIAEAIAEQNDNNIEIDRRRIEIRTPIKTVGEHEVDISLYRDIKATIKLVVLDEGAPEEPTEAEAIKAMEAEEAENAAAEAEAKGASKEASEKSAEASADEQDEQSADANTGNEESAE